MRFGSLNMDLGDLPLRYGHHKGSLELREFIAQDYKVFL